MKTCTVEGCEREQWARTYCHAHYSRWHRHGNPTAGIKWGEGKEWIRRHVSHTGDACLMYPFHKDPNGYARVNEKGKSSLGTRMMCALAHGEPPSNKHHAAHSCGNPSCINPMHLRWATPSENERDKVLHGTSNRGSRHGMSKLKAEQVLTILNDNRSSYQVAKDFGVSPRTIRMIREGRNWSWLTKQTVEAADISLRKQVE